MCVLNMNFFILLPLDLSILLAAYAADSCTHKIVEKIILTCDRRRVFVYYLNVLAMSVYAAINGQSMKNIE